MAHDTSDGSEVTLAIACSFLSAVEREGVYHAVRERRTFSALRDNPAIAATLQRFAREATTAYEHASRLGLQMIPLSAESYPRLLRESSHPPFLIYALSDQKEFHLPEAALGIVGTRAAPVDVCAQTTLLSFELAKAGVTIVSGLALGVDGAAHRGAVQGGGSVPTVAVLAHGLDRVYPRAHQMLVGSIVEAGGVIVSEYAPGVAPLKCHFLERNRIIAALSRGVVVAQAGERSGSLVTATYALDYGRDVFVLDGYLDAVEYAGSRRLLEDGAKVVSRASEILREYPELCSPPALDGTAIPQEEREWVIMTLTELREDRLRHAPTFTPLQMLRLELEGKLVRLPNNQVAFCRSQSGEEK